MSIRSDHSQPRTPKERKESGGGLRIADVLAGGLASAVAAIVGGTLGAVGSVVSAFIVSIVSGLVLPLLRRPLRTGEEKLRGLGTREHQSSSTTSVAGRTPSWTGAGTETTASGSRHPSGSRSRRRKKIWILVGSVALSLVLGFGAIFLTQTLTGTQLSNGTGTLQQGVTGTHPTADTTPTEAPAAQTPTTTPHQEQTSAPAPAASPSATADGTDTPDGNTATTPTPDSEGNTGSSGTGTSDNGTGETGSIPSTPAQ